MHPVLVHPSSSSNSSHSHHHHHSSNAHPLTSNGQSISPHHFGSSSKPKRIKAHEDDDEAIAKKKKNADAQAAFRLRRQTYIKVCEMILFFLFFFGFRFRFSWLIHHVNGRFFFFYSIFDFIMIIIIPSWIPDRDGVSAWVHPIFSTFSISTLEWWFWISKSLEETVTELKNAVTEMVSPIHCQSNS